LFTVAGVLSGCFTQAPTGQPAAKREQESRRAPRPDRVRIDVAVQGVQLPAALTFAPDGRMFFVEVNAGRVRVVKDGKLVEQPVATFPVQQASESGLLGLTLDPDFAANGRMYAYYSESRPEAPERGVRNRVVRFVERDGLATEITPILDDLPNSAEGAMDAHQGGSLIFGHDKKLYVSIGETGKPHLAQDPQSLAGKVLRINSDGTVPTDNPVPGSPIFASGLRNVWGFAVHPRTGAIYMTNNGNKAHDKVLLLQPGANYGWPIFEGEPTDPKYTGAVWDSGDGADSRNGMVGLTIYDGAMFPDYRGQLFFCAFRTGKLRRLTLAGESLDAADSQQRIEAECRLDVATAPDGSIYTSTIDKVFRLSR
jgi:glucose/arabinose dehydrogenase